MKKEELFELLGNIDETYIKTVGVTEKSSKKKGWIKGISIAACLALIAVIGVGMLQGKLFGGKSKNTDIVILENGDIINFVKSDLSTDSISADMDVTIRELTKEELTALFGDLPADVHALYTSKSRQLVGFEGKIDGIKAVISTSDISVLDAIVAGSEGNSKISGTPVTTGYFLTDANSKGVKTAIYYASFKLGSSTVYLENAGTQTQSETVKEQLISLIKALIDRGELDLSQF